MIWSLQTLRFAAALMVVYVHAAQTAFAATGSNGFLPQEFQIAGRAGVDIFFVISGVIITRTALGLTWQSFAWKRVRRIIPIYFLACIPAMFIAGRSGIEWRELIATFLLWPATDVMTAPILPVAWTLCFEALFYAAFAIVLFDGRLLYPVLGVFAGSMLLRPYGPVFQFLGNPLILEFMMGMGLAYLPMKRAAIWGIPIGAILLVAVGFAGVAPTGGTMEFLVGEDGFQRVLVYGIPSAMIVYGVMQVETKESFWTEMGDASYSLYLTHTFLVSALLTLWMTYPLPPDLIIGIVVLACVVFGWRVHVRFEAPLLLLLKPGTAVASGTPRATH